jgi:hypothetical protein
MPTSSARFTIRDGCLKENVHGSLPWPKTPSVTIDDVDAVVSEYYRKLSRSHLVEAKDDEKDLALLAQIIKVEPSKRRPRRSTRVITYPHCGKVGDGEEVFWDNSKRANKRPKNWNVRETKWWRHSQMALAVIRA